MCHVRRLNANCKEVRVSIFVSAPFGINAKPAAATLANDDDGVGKIKKGGVCPLLANFFYLKMEKPATPRSTPFGPLKGKKCRPDVYHFNWGKEEQGVRVDSNSDRVVQRIKSRFSRVAMGIFSGCD